MSKGVERRRREAKYEEAYVERTGILRGENVD